MHFSIFFDLSLRDNGIGIKVLNITIKILVFANDIFMKIERITSQTFTIVKNKKLQ